VRALAREARVLAQNTQALMHQDAPARWAAWLLARMQPLAEAPGRGIVQLPLRKRDIASQLAITPETLSRLMRSFTAQGVIAVAGYTVHVHDRCALARLAEA
jgi:CRP-like cAMP-binding protein